MRIVSWNTLWRFGKWEARQPLLADALLGQAPDVVLLQETWPDQARALAAAVGLDVLGFGGGYFDSELSDVPTDEMFGNAILAREGELVIDQAFSSEGDPAPRWLLGARVGGILLGVVHLSHVAARGDIRSGQLHQIVGRLAESDESFLLGGDCNLVPSSSEYQTAIGLGLRDVWRSLRPNEHGATMVPANPEISQTSWMDDRNGAAAPKGTGVRFDYLWSHGSLEVRSIDRFGEHTGARWPSDHLGLVAEI